MTGNALLLSCEHATNFVPRQYTELFRSKAASRALSSHRGWDIGALEVARTLSKRLGVPLFSHDATRLLIEPNVSENHPRLFSEFSCQLDPKERDRLLARHYTSHRLRIERAIADRARKKQLTVHVGVHSFASRLRGENRQADIGLLYDPARKRERDFCARWKSLLQQRLPDFRIRRNYPYRGNADGLTTALREEFAPNAYLGLELELNQRLLAGGPPEPLLDALRWSLQRMIQQ